MLNTRNAKIYAIVSREKAFILAAIFSFNCPPLLGVVLRDKPSENWIEEKMDLFKNEVCECGSVSMQNGGI